MSEFLKRYPVRPPVHLDSTQLLDPPDGRDIGDVLPDGIEVQEIRVVEFNGVTYNTAIGPKPGSERNWAVNVSRKTAKSLIGRG